MAVLEMSTFPLLDCTLLDSCTTRIPVLTINAVKCLCNASIAGQIIANKSIQIPWYHEILHYPSFRRSFPTHAPSRPGVHITKNPNFDPISTFSYFHYKKLGSPNFL